MPNKSAATTLAAATFLVAVAGWWAAGGRNTPSAGLAQAPEGRVPLPQAATKPTISGNVAPPVAMQNVGTYAALRLQEIKGNHEVLSDVWKWRQEWHAASTPELKREVLGLASQVGPDAFLAILPEAVDAAEEALQLESVRALALLPEDRLREGVAIAINAGDADTRAEAMEVIGQLNPALQPKLILTAVQVGTPDVQKIAIGMAEDRPSPEMFEVLLQGLRSENPETAPLFEEAIAGMVRQRFRSYDEASRWWAANRETFDSMMLRVE